MSYKSQNKRGRQITPIGKLREMEEDVGRTHYRGKQTRRYKRYLKRSRETLSALNQKVKSIK